MKGDEALPVCRCGYKPITCKGYGPNRTIRYFTVCNPPGGGCKRLADLNPHNPMDRLVESNIRATRVTQYRESIEEARDEWRRLQDAFREDPK